MRSLEKHIPPGPEKKEASKDRGESETRARLIARHLERIVAEHASAGEEAEKEIGEYYAKIGARDKADILYKKLMAYTVDRHSGAETDPYLISEIKILSADVGTKELFCETYAEARIDEKLQRGSELGKLWSAIGEEITRKEEEYKELERDLHLKRVSGRSKISSIESRMQRFAEQLQGLERRRQELESLSGLPAVAEHTDAAANFRYETLKEYRRQLARGFVWLPSRKRIHRETVSAILNHRWPVLVGEAGSGKSDQADAAAIELTGSPPTEVECESVTGEKQLIKDTAIDPGTGGSYEEYGPLMRAFTGYDDSRGRAPAFTSGRVARFDESGRLGPKAYSMIKKARQKKAGDDFYGHPVLPGASAIWTTNPVGPRYPDRHAPDPAMRRELAEIYVSYPEMSGEDPELYEFMLAALFDEDDHISVAKQELAPAYEKKEIPKDERKALEDGSVIVAEDALVRDAADPRHGALWRFAAAVKALQESFVYGNAETEKYPDTLLRFKENEHGDIIISESGEPLTLSTSTVTLGELASWMSGFNERMQKRDADFRVDTLTEWLDFKIRTYLKQADTADKRKIEAIFRHFHFLQESKPDVAGATPLTPKEIGYLSPRVQRPAYLERPHAEEEVEEEPAKKEKAKKYETKQVLLDTGARVLMDARDMKGGEGIPLEILLGQKFIVDGKEFIFSGVVEDRESAHHGQPIGKFAGEDLYRIFSPEEVDMGLLVEFQRSLRKRISDSEESVSEYSK